MQTASSVLNRLLARGKFRHLQVLARVAELGSLQRAAEAIGLTQSSVTQTIAYLEALLETPLFERHARGMRPTAACEELLPLARQLLRGVAESAQVVAGRSQRGQGVVRLVASISAIHGLLIDALPRFSAAHPGVQVHLSEAEGEDQLQAIARGEVDLVACRRPPVVPEGWRFEALREDRFAVLCRTSHPLAQQRGAVGWDALADATWLPAPAGSAARAQFDDRMQALAATPRLHPIVTRSPSMLWWLLRHSELLAFLPLNFARPLLEAGELRALDVRPATALEPLGLLMPAAGPAQAAALLADTLRAGVSPEPRSAARPGVRTTGPSKAPSRARSKAPSKAQSATRSITRSASRSKPRSTP